MTTSTDSSPIAQTDDATNRAWATALSNELDNYLPVTADTGQINLATFTRASAGNAAGYQIRRMDDTLQGTAPIVMKIEYGSGASSDRPAVWITVGTGSNGSGTITGAFVPRTLISASNIGSLLSTVTNYPSFWCAVDGFFGMAFKVGAYSSNTASKASAVAVLVIQRSVDSSGDPTTEGAMVHIGGNQTANDVTAYSVNFGTSASYGPANSFAVVPFAVASATIGAGTQEFGHTMAMPEMRRCAFTLTAIAGDIADAATFSATPVGVTSHTYLQLGNCAGGAAANSLAAHRLCMTYE